MLQDTKTIAPGHQHNNLSKPLCCSLHPVTSGPEVALNWRLENCPNVEVERDVFAAGGRMYFSECDFSGCWELLVLVLVLTEKENVLQRM